MDIGQSSILSRRSFSEVGSQLSILRSIVNLKVNSEIEFNEEDIFITIVPLGIDNAPVNAPVNQTQIDIVKAMQNNSNISYNEIAQIIEKDRTTVMRNIQKLKELGIIKRIGSDKTGYWEVIE